jgi:hypothetical protein
MNYLLALIFTIAGVACCIYYKPLYQAYARFMAKRFDEQFERVARFMGWDDPSNRWQLIIYKTGVVALGVFLLVMALHFAIDPIYTGSAAN